MADRDWTNEPAKDSTVAADKVLILDSEASNANKLAELGNLNITFNQLSGSATNAQLPADVQRTSFTAARFANVVLASAFSATPTFNLGGNEIESMPLTGDITAMTTSGRLSGRKKQVVFAADATNRTITFNTAWKTYPEVLAFTVKANSTAILSLLCTGSAEANVIAGIAEFA